MGWPTPQEYNEAIQNERLCFLDDELQQGTVEVNKLGLPKAVTGSFASVYCVTVGSKKYAVRCFLHEIPDQQLRYKRLSTSICSDSLEYTVDFEFQAKGIRVKDETFPVLKMEWVQGETLDVFARRNHQNKDAMSKLQSDFRRMLKALSDEGFAHADLQHGNILVTDQGLRLVDYDGMFVPSLSGLLSNELGHRNYQHPGRTKDHFGPYLDNFSAWVIDTALTCLVEDASLYETLKCGDEAVLFHSADYTKPDESEIFFALERHESKIVRSASRRMRTILSCLPYNVPPLSEDVAEAKEHPKVVAEKRRQKEEAKRVAEWAEAARVTELKLQHQKELAEQAAREAAARATMTHPMPGWLDENTASVLTAPEKIETAAGDGDDSTADGASGSSITVPSAAGGVSGVPPGSVPGLLTLDACVNAMRIPQARFTGEFQSVSVACDSSGEPINYGSRHAVFHVWNKNRDAALKLFVKPVERLEDRYAATSEAIDKLPKNIVPFFLKCGVKNELITGIIVPPSTTPTDKTVFRVTTRWQDKAQRLSDILRTGKPDFDWTLLTRFRRMCHAIQAAGIAHGSLDPDNILVLPDYQLVLVDYDNFYAPSMSSLQLRAAEFSPENLRHPLSTLDDFGPTIDYFPSWLIDTMILIWSADRALWRNFMSNKGALFFSSEDMAYPGHSPVLAALADHQDYDISTRGHQVIDFLRMSPQKIPSLAKFYS